MGTTAQKLNKLIDTKAAIKSAIEAKSVTVGSIPFGQYPDKIASISTCGIVGTGQFLVRFFDFDGTILKQERVAAGGTVTAPLIPTHEYLTFHSWNNALTNIQSDLDVGAIYNTTNGKSYLFITVNSITGLSPTLYFNKSTTSLMTINWGDNSTSTSTTSGNQNRNHTYSVAGDYIITIENSAGGVWSIGNGTTATTFFGNNATNPYLYCLTKIYFGANMTTYQRYAMHAHNSVTYVSWGSYLTTIPANSELFYNCNKVNHCNIPIGVTLLGANMFGIQAYSLKSLSLPNTITTIYTNLIYNGSLTKLVLPATLTTINASTFVAANNVEKYIFLSTTPPTLANINAFTGINPLCKIYVPDASVAAYKAATNWITYAAYIYPISSM